MSKSLYARLAWQNLRKNARFYLPYILTIIGTAASFYIMVTLSLDGGLPERARYAYLQTYVAIGTIIIGLFSVVFMLYTNSFLMKQRKRELGLYNVLGMGKKHIATVLTYETLYTALIGIPSGIAVGMLFQSAVTALAVRLMKFDIYYGRSLSPLGAIITLVFFAFLLALCLAVNLIRQSRQNPVELMREGSAGEKEPRTRWFLTILGVASLGGGYYIALSAKSAVEALAMYFLAVFLVIIGTYCLFTSVSIAVLKLLRCNKRFYYRTDNFIGISGMLYRMKRNAVGLANICILLTMVLVAVSSTLSLYLGTEDILDTQYPKDVNIILHYDPNNAVPLDKNKFILGVSQACESSGMKIEGDVKYDELLDSDGFVTADGLELGASSATTRATLSVMTKDMYIARTGAEDFELEKGEIMLYCNDFSIPGDTFAFRGIVSTENGRETVGTIVYKIKGRIYDNNGKYGYSINSHANCIVVVSDYEELKKVSALDMKSYSDNVHTKWYVSFDTDGTDEQNIGFGTVLNDTLSDIAGGAGEWEYYMVDTRAQNARDFYENNGGFFFLGVFLGLLFMMAAALIIYYKQITEGYEDRERFRIMRQVGLDRRELRRSVNSQILVVFFAPLAVSALHIAFDFPLVKLLLTLFGLMNTTLTLLCTLGTLLVFALIYGVVFILTAKAYNRIVN